MKRTLVALASGLMLTVAASTAQALTVLTATDADPRFLGAVDPGSGSPDTQAGLINSLLTIPADAGADDGFSVTIDGRLYNRSDNACAACPAASTTGELADDTDPSTTIDVNDWTYLKAKYGNTMVVWFVADVNDTVQIPANFGPGGSDPGAGGGLSHWVLYNPTPSVPDGGATLGLLGLGMLGLGYLRRRNQK